MVLFQETIFHYIESLSFLDVENAFLRESDVSRQLGEEKINLRCKTCKFTAAKTTQILFLCALLGPRNTILMLMFFCRGLCGRIRCDSVGGAFWRLVLADIGEARGSFGFAPSGTTTQLYSLLLYILPVSTFSRAKSPIIFQSPKIIPRWDLSEKKSFDLITLQIKYWN